MPYRTWAWVRAIEWRFCGSPEMPAKLFRRYAVIKARILVLTTSYPSHEGDPSGVFIAKLLSALHRRGYDLSVLAPSDGETFGRTIVHGIETDRFSYFFPRHLQMLTRPGGGIPENMQRSFLARIQVLPMMAVFLLKALRGASGCDLIYGNWLGAGIIGAAVSMLTGKPLVVTFRGDDGYLARDRLLWRILTKWVCRRAGLTAPVSSEIGRILSSLGVPESKLRVPVFGVDTEVFHPPREQDGQGDRVQVLFVGSLIERKGIHDLIEALADESLSAVTLVIVGQGPLESQLRTRADELGLTQRISWHLSLPQTEVAQVMRESDILCLPSYMEGRPNVVNEAMASGLPVIVTRIGGIPDMVDEGESALLIEPGDVEQLRTHLIRLAHDPGLREQMGDAARRRIVDTGVSWDATAAELDEIFRSVIPAGTR